MSSTYWASTLLMGALAVFVLLVIVQNRQWYHYSAEPAEGDESTPALEGESKPPLLERPLIWLGGWVLLMKVVIGSLFIFVTNPDAPGELMSMPILAGGGALVGGYLLYGTYSAAKGRGHPSSIAAAETATLVGALFLVAVSVQLIG